MFDVIIPASGKSIRFGGSDNKIFANILGTSVIERTVSAFLNVDGLDKIIIPTTKENLAKLLGIFGDNKRIQIIEGGDSRTISVKNALSFVTSDYVLIHDGVRPYVTTNIIKGVLAGAIEKGASVPLVKIADSVTNIANGYTPVNRDELRLVQTPQGFKSSLIKDVYDNITSDYTDDISVYLTKYHDISVINGNVDNKKITYQSDMDQKICRTGVGFDTHRLVVGRKLILGGLDIPHSKGLLGHSDADVLVHAIMDAILSACALPDIGVLFPDSDIAYKDANSIELLKKAVMLVSANGYCINNISATILAEKPRLSTYRDDMRQNIANAINIDINNVGIAFTTTEGIYEIGREEAISAIATASIIRQ